MKKLLAILMTLCLLCAAFAAVADMEIPNWDDMPQVIIEDDDTEVDEAAFEGEWVLGTAFLESEYISLSDLIDLIGFNTMPIVISEGKITQDYQQENGEFITLETTYTFESGQLQAEDTDGQNFVIEQLEDGNIVISLFIPGEGETVKCISLFMVHPEE